MKVILFSCSLAHTLVPLIVYERTGEHDNNNPLFKVDLLFKIQLIHEKSLQLASVSVIAKPSSHRNDFKQSRGGSGTVTGDYKSILGGGSSTDHKPQRASGPNFRTTISVDYEELRPKRKQSTMTPTERQSLATRISASILGPMKQFQANVARSKQSGVHIDLPPDPPEDTDEEKAQAIMDAIKSDEL